MGSPPTPEYFSQRGGRVGTRRPTPGCLPTTHVDLKVLSTLSAGLGAPPRNPGSAIKIVAAPFRLWKNNAIRYVHFPPFDIRAQKRVSRHNDEIRYLPLLPQRAAMMDETLKFHAHLRRHLSDPCVRFHALNISRSLYVPRKFFHLPAAFGGPGTTTPRAGGRSNAFSIPATARLTKTFRHHQRLLGSRKIALYFGRLECHR